MISEWKKYLVEVGIGIDHHGQDPTSASKKAVSDAIQRVCIPYLVSEDFKKKYELKIHVRIGVPMNDKVNKEEVLRVIPINGNKEIEVINGGLVSSCVMLREYGDKSDDMIIAVASITILFREKNGE